MLRRFTLKRPLGCGSKGVLRSLCDARAMTSSTEAVALKTNHHPTKSVLHRALSRAVRPVMIDSSVARRLALHADG